MLTKLGSRSERKAETDYARPSVQRPQMLLGDRQRIQRGQAARAPSVFDAQLSSDASQEFGGSCLHWQRAAQKEQLPALHRFDIGAKRGWWTRQDYAKVLQPSFGTVVRCAHGQTGSPCISVAFVCDHITTDPDARRHQRAALRL